MFLFLLEERFSRKENQTQKVKLTINSFHFQFSLLSKLVCVSKKIRGGFVFVLPQFPRAYLLELIFAVIYYHFQSRPFIKFRGKSLKKFVSLKRSQAENFSSGPISSEKTFTHAEKVEVESFDEQ
jgi:hypothetical protein